MRLVLDTNFIIDIMKFKIDLWASEYELYTFSEVLKELEKIAKTNARDAKFARLALQHVKNIKIINGEGRSVDDMLFNASKNKINIIATNDAALRKKIKSIGGRVAFIRQRKYVVIS
jgi:rRNA-processing protein FCF1